MTYGMGIVLVLGAGLLWSAMGLGVRTIQEASAFQILLYRSLGVMPALLALMAVRNGNPWRALADAGLPSIVGGACLVVAFMGSIISLKATTVANAAFLWSTSPLFAAVLGHFLLGERVRLATWIGLAVAALGVCVMVFDGISAGRLVGNIAAIVCALGFGGFTVALRWEPSGDSLPATFYGGLFCSAASAAAVFMVGEPLLPSAHDAGIAFGLGALVLAGGLALYTFGARVVPAAELPLLALIEVVLGPVWVFLVFGEKVGLYTIAGGAIVLLGLAVSAAAGIFGEGREPGRV